MNMDDHWDDHLGRVGAWREASGGIKGMIMAGFFTTDFEVFAGKWTVVE